jgi:hypothetical protein
MSPPFTPMRWREPQRWLLLHVSSSTDGPIVRALLAFVTTLETQKKKAPMRGEREQINISKDSSRLSSSLVGTTRLQEDMAGPIQNDLECLKILLPRMHTEKLVSACFSCVESDLLEFAFGKELVPDSWVLWTSWMALDSCHHCISLFIDSK